MNYRYNAETDLGYAGFVDIGKFTLFRTDEFAAGALTGKSPSVYFRNFTGNPVFHLRLYNLGTYIQDQWVVTGSVATFNLPA